MGAEPFPFTASIYPHFPTPLIAHIRQVVDAGTASDRFSCYCTLLEWLALHLASLGNSIYAGQPDDAVDTTIETRLRTTGPVSFGVAVGGIRLFANLPVHVGLPEFREAITGKLPTTCAVATRALSVMKRGREDYDIPTMKLGAYVTTEIGTPRGVTLGDFLNAVVPFRNKGIGHQAEESWFPRDQRMYSLVCEYLTPAVDDLLCWEPLRGLLTELEVVELFTRDDGDGRSWTVRRPHVSDGRAPLGTSHVWIPSGTLEAKPWVARRGEAANDLTGVVAHAQFPRALQSIANLVRQYADAYLTAYLEHGLITPTQRQSRLAPKAGVLGLPETERIRVEGEIQDAINHFSSDAPQASAESLRRVQAVVSPSAADGIEARVRELPVRRKAYIFDQIENNGIMAFAQLRTESELSEPDLDSVLADLEQEDRVRQLNGTGHVGRLQSHFKAQDPTKQSRLRAILDDLGKSRRRAELPAPTWRLVELCVELLGEDGFAFGPGEIDGFAHLFAGGSSGGEEDTAMTVTVGGEGLHPTNVRELFEVVSRRMADLGIGFGPIVPLLIGKTRYLIAHTPVHANETPFAVPIHIGDYYFEGNLTRAQALAEIIRAMRKVGVEADSPDVEIAESGETDEAPVEADEPESEGAAVPLSIRVTSADGNETTEIRGRTVAQFFIALLDFLLDHEADLADVVPVASGRVRYVVADEPYHKNGRPFFSRIERGGYFINTAYSYEQALVAAATLCDKLGFSTDMEPAEDDNLKLAIEIDGVEIDEHSVPAFLKRAFTVLFDQGRFGPADIPYKSGRVRYLIAEVPTHDHGRRFIRPIEIELGGRQYFIEANMSRPGAIDLVERLVASRGRLG